MPIPFTAHVDWRGGAISKDFRNQNESNPNPLQATTFTPVCPVVNVTLKLRVWLQCLLLRTSSGKRLKRQWLHSCAGFGRHLPGISSPDSVRPRFRHLHHPPPDFVTYLNPILRFVIPPSSPNHPNFKGINGQLPNLDLINTVAHISQLPSYLPDHPGLQRYLAGRTIVKQMSYGFTGSPSGPEGLFSTYGIDAISLFAHPADGPHGFQTLSTIIESSLRSLNNLLERLTIKGLAKWGIANQEWENTLYALLYHLRNLDLK
ncbi:hypothetical protein KEM48_002851 [Puccinia striiformis f. sp. tritici PST-130]|nr:hypothetical protein KEM48_002851 [Puccinia striiformis f. sp. tritici PST-130]